MASRLNIILEVISHYKYLITIVVGLLVVGVLDDNSFRKRIQYELQISELEDQIEFYNKQYERDSKNLLEIKKDPKAIEKIARERYFMKADDEDIFVLSTDEQAEKNTNEDDETIE
ncbi:FtsB family cell division protein [Segatella albensis]|jgi:cell division protein FtsB|uniref:FtsB family cell division protein n=1 Tax=Segatella albensis TaxID=77768 RepID=UPI000468E903|nr:septum formation initiator family protein [Segatella albensis]